MSMSARTRVPRRERLGAARYWLYLPDRLVESDLDGVLHAPSIDPGCPIPPDNSGVVTVEVSIGPDGKHRLVRVWAEGKRIDRDVLQGYADLVCGAWSSDPPRLPDGSGLREGETVRMLVAFPIAASSGHGAEARAA